MKCYVVGAVIGACCLVVALLAGPALPAELGSDAGPQAAGGTGRTVPLAELEPLLGAMRAADAVLDQPLTVAFEIAIPSSPLGPDRGRQTKVCKFTSCNGVRGLSVETHYEAPSAFRPRGTPGYDSIDYDSQGNLIVWHARRKLSLSTPDFNRTLDEQRMLRISPQSTIIEQIDRQLVYEYDTGSPNSTYEFDQFRLATGHIAAHLQRVRSGEVRRDGLHELRCAGSYGFRGHHTYFSRL